MTELIGAFFAFIFAICAFMTIRSEFFDAVVFVGLGLLCLPGFNRLLAQHWRIKPRIRFLAFVAGMVFVNVTPAPTAAIAPSPVAPSPVASSPLAAAIAPSPSPSIQATPAPSVVAPAVAPGRTPATIVSVGDGDTLRAQVGSGQITVRLAYIDAPESAQPQGQQAGDLLEELLPRGTQVELREVDTDRYGRTVAEVYRDGRSINLQMVQEGYGVVYRDYLDGCPNADEYLAAEATAKEQQLGFWSESNLVMPWDWRQGQRPSQAAIPASNCDPAYPDFCIPLNSPDLDCKDISQSGFTVKGSDRHRLDRDRDGIGCESN